MKRLTRRSHTVLYIDDSDDNPAHVPICARRGVIMTECHGELLPRLW